MNAIDPTSFARKLLRWYEKNKRNLPWRKTRDPYTVWVSEIMLQQTQVSTVIPYFERFMERFPTVKKLAGAAEEEVLALWSGLGYYRRAKLLHGGAKKVVQEFGGRLPQDVAQLRELPGIGAYTAGAVASIAFGKAEPLVDGNVVRVLSRVFALKGHAKENKLQKLIWDHAAELLPKKNPGDFNQALMELGATVCRAALPSCAQCPVADLCRAYRTGRPEDFPEPAPSHKTVRLKRMVAVCRQSGKILLVRRRESRWFQGLWELPHDFFADSPNPYQGLTKFLNRSLGISLKTPQEIRPTEHSITHHRITSYAWHGQMQGRLRPGPYYEMTKFFDKDALQAAALSNFDRKVLCAGGIL